MKYPLYILVLLVTVAAYGQKKRKETPPPPTVERTTYARLPHSIPYNQIKKKFPFSQAAAVLLVSFTATGGIDPGIVWDGDTSNIPIQYVPEREPGSVDTFGHKEVREVKVIGEKEVAHIADMFYNLSCGNGPLTQAGCYSPRNAIIFLDRAGNFVAELEICFQCEGYELRPKEFHAGDMRRCKYDELRKLFARAGVHYGVDEQ